MSWSADEARELARSLSAEARLQPYLPELLSDLWSLGCSPDPLIRLLRRSSLADQPDLSVLDLGCGKGAALIRIARELGGRSTGVDLMPEFLAEARARAAEHGVQDRVQFHERDLALELQGGERVDLVLYGVDSEVLGPLELGLRAIERRLKPTGHVVLDLVWNRPGRTRPSEAPDEGEVRRAIAASGFAVADREILDPAWVREQNAWNTARIRERAQVLAGRHPALRAAFLDYVRAQEEESKELEEELVCALLLLRREPSPDLGSTTAELIARAEEDFRVRSEVEGSGVLHEGYHPRMEAVHRANAAFLAAVIDRHGWPTEPLFGKDAVESAWLIVQHAIGEPALQRRALALLTDAAQLGRVPAWQAAMLEDRIRMLEDRSQRYGTQLEPDASGRPRPYRLEEPEHVNERRRAVGLEPLAERLAREGPIERPSDPARFAQEFEAWLHRVGLRTKPG